jgi:hypothetical protein
MSTPEDRIREELRKRRTQAAAEVAGTAGWKFMRLDLFALAKQAPSGERAAGIYDAVAQIERYANEDYVRSGPEVLTLPGVSDGR